MPTFDNFVNGYSTNDTLVGVAGQIDRLQGGAGNDTYFVNDRDDKVVEFAGGGVDTVVSTVTWALGVHLENLTLAGNAKIGGTGNDRANVLQGNDASNFLDGRGGRDTIDAGGGDDVITGGLGDDVITGGAGNDRFWFSTAIDEDVDTITDFTVGSDRFDLSSDIFFVAEGALSDGAFTIGSGATTSAQRIVYNDQTGELFYDADGSGVGQAIKFAQVGPGLSLSAADFFVV